MAVDLLLINLYGLNFIINYNVVCIHYCRLPLVPQSDPVSLEGCGQLRKLHAKPTMQWVWPTYLFTVFLHSADDGMESVLVTVLRRTLASCPWSICVGVSKGMWAVKRCFNKILQFLTSGVSWYGFSLCSGCRMVVVSPFSRWLHPHVCSIAFRVGGS